MYRISAHNPKVIGSNPIPATRNLESPYEEIHKGFFLTAPVFEGEPESPISQVNDLFMKWIGNFLAILIGALFLRQAFLIFGQKE